MRIFQVMPTIAPGDAVSNDALAIRKILEDSGRTTGIFAENIHPRLAGTAQPVSGLPELRAEDLLLYHASTGTPLNDALPGWPCRKVMIYHNITPPEWFAGYSESAVELTTEGYRQIRRLAGAVECCIADSEYNRQELVRMGYTCPIHVCPVIVPFEDYRREPDAEVLDRFRDGRTNLLFVGRIAPNKRQEDVIRTFRCYTRRFDPEARLILAGNAGGMERYEARLKAYAEKLGVGGQVVFTGHISFRAILAFYRAADAFVCMSGHEGFCVPLLEAMSFGLPIVAFAAAAVPETLGKGGLLLRERDPELAAAAVHRLLTDGALREQLAAEQRKELERFAYENVRGRFEAMLREIAGRKAPERGGDGA